MAIRDGRGTNRRHGHNYIGKQADARMQEIIAPAQQRGLNALDVDSFEVLYYRRANSSMPCSCQKATAPGLIDHSAVDESNALPINLVPEIDVGEDQIVIDHHSSLFGTSSTTGDHDDDTFDSNLGGAYDDEEIVEDDDTARSQDKLFALSTECGICYRNGMLPGYELYGHDRKVLTGAVISDTYGYLLDQSQAPSKFVCIDPEGAYVDFEIEIPKYFQSMRYSVRDNLNHLADEPLYIAAPGAQLINLAAVRLSAGSKMIVRVRADRFTHVVVEFDLGVEPIRAALAQDTKATDWTMFDTIGTLSIVLPMTIDSVETSDVIYVPERKYTFKVSDVTYLRTARNKNMDWQVQARVLQPQEGLKRIYQANKMR